ncbi:MAG: LysR family transcriptional regulator, partial [Clostridia bacterium]|nr:LysR family transcriptional regulator [Clostridia bacterium]
MAQSKYKIFLSVVEQGSLTRAAEKCGITQSAVSHALHALEGETGLSLLRRSRGGVRLTPEGEKLLPAVRRIVDALDGFAAEAIQLSRQEGCLIRIGAFASVAVHWLPRIIKDFQKAHPQADFRMLTGDYHDIAQWFEDGSIDVGFVTREMKLPGCTTIPLTEDRLLAVLPADHPLAGRERIAAGALRGENFISLMENSNQDARSVLEAAGVEVDVKYTAKDDYAIIAMVKPDWASASCRSCCWRGIPTGWPRWRSRGPDGAPSGWPCPPPVRGSPAWKASPISSAAGCAGGKTDRPQQKGATHECGDQADHCAGRRPHRNHDGLDVRLVGRKGELHPGGRAPVCAEQLPAPPALHLRPVCRRTIAG